MSDPQDYFAADTIPEPPTMVEEAPPPEMPPTRITKPALDCRIPANTDAETVILGAIMLDNTAMGEAGVLDKEDFCLDSNQRVFERMKDLLNADRAVDIVTLSEELARNKEVESVGGVAYLASLTEGLPRRPVISDYIRIVKDKAVMRRLLTTFTASTARCYDQSDSALEVAADAVAKVTSIVDGASHAFEKEVWGPEDGCDETEWELLDNPNMTVPMSTGVPNLDAAMGGGIQLGELWIIGGAPSSGKTTLARQIVGATVSKDIPAYVHSAEMKQTSWRAITACLLSGMAVPPFRNRSIMTAQDKMYLRAALRQLKNLPLYISEKGSMPLDRFIWHSKKMIRNFGAKLIVGDYAQIFNAPGRDPRERMTNVAYACRDLAKEENVAVVLLSQLARPEGRDINAKPNMRMLRESGAFEDAAQAVLLPYIPTDPETDQPIGKDEIIVGKFRDGARGGVPVKLNGPYRRFDDRY